MLAGVPLAEGALLLLAAVPDPDELVAIRVAAQPLLELLAGRGLLSHTAPSALSPTARRSRT
jgi:hypothetical protein